METQESITASSVLTRNQKKTRRKDYIADDGRPETIIVEIRYDDDCGNGHNTFAMTADIYTQDRQPGERTIKHQSEKTLWQNGGGCVHDEIAKHFPDLAKYIKWHLCSSDGPMHYIQNTVFLAGDKDCWGRRKGDPSAHEYGVRFNSVPVTHIIKKSFFDWLRGKVQNGERNLAIVAVEHGPDPISQKYGTKFDAKYTFTGYTEKWHECPFDSKTEAEEWQTAIATCGIEWRRIDTAFSEGKERELDKARNAAIWPDATDEDLTAPGLEDRLKARLPGLLMAFKHDVEELGFTF